MNIKEEFTDLLSNPKFELLKVKATSTPLSVRMTSSGSYKRTYGWS